MAGMKLLEAAHAAGLKVRVEGDRLIIRGPKSAERIAQALLEKKAEVLTLLYQQSPLPCTACRGAVRLEPAVPEELPTRIWTCVQCGAWGGTRDGATYAEVWIGRATVQ